MQTVQQPFDSQCFQSPGHGIDVAFIGLAPSRVLRFENGPATVAVHRVTRIVPMQLRCGSVGIPVGDHFHFD